MVGMALRACLEETPGHGPLWEFCPLGPGQSGLVAWLSPRPFGSATTADRASGLVLVQRQKDRDVYTYTCAWVCALCMCAWHVCVQWGTGELVPQIQIL